MATKKGKKTKGKKIKVTKPRKKPKASKKRKRGRGRGQYSNFFPTNRQVDSNQYWQLRAEIAGAEARVRTGLRDQMDDESKAKKKAEKKVEKLERDVVAVSRDVARAPKAQPNITFSPSNIIGTPGDGDTPASRRQQRRRKKTPFTAEESSIAADVDRTQEFAGFRQPGIGSGSSPEAAAAVSSDEYSSTDDAMVSRDLTVGRSIYDVGAPSGGKFKKRTKKKQQQQTPSIAEDPEDPGATQSRFRTSLSAKKQARASQLLDETEQRSQRGYRVDTNPAAEFTVTQEDREAVAAEGRARTAKAAREKAQLLQARSAAGPRTPSRLTDTSDVILGGSRRGEEPVDSEYDWE